MDNFQRSVAVTDKEVRSVADKLVFEREIYTRANNPYLSWLKVTTEKALFEYWLRGQLLKMKIATTARWPISVLDLGCSFGSTSLRLMRVLDELGISFRYTGVDPYEEQLQRFAELTKDMYPPSRPRLIVGDVESYVPDREYDLVLASHSLYYTNDMQSAVDRIVSAGREAIIVHHGRRGIHTFHERFRCEIKPGPHIISTDEDVAKCLALTKLGGRGVKRYGFPSTVDISSCLDPESRCGQDLLSFFFERMHETLPPSLLDEARTFLRETYAPHYCMTHDVGIFVVS